LTAFIDVSGLDRDAVAGLDGRFMSAFVRARKPAAAASTCCASSCCA